MVPLLPLYIISMTFSYITITKYSLKHSWSKNWTSFHTFKFHMHVPRDCWLLKSD